MKIGVTVGLALLLIQISTQITYGKAVSDKAQYNISNPVPRELMREMSTDRPDKTESAYTVDAGHYQIETSFLDYTYDHKNTEKTDQRMDSFSVFPINFKVGLLNNVDVQFVFNPYIREHSEGDDEKEIKRGVGDLQNRIKINVWGNDGGQTALAFMPFVKYPTNTDELGNHAVEGGVIVPFAISLPADWSMGLMTEFDFNRNTQKDYYTDFVNTMTLGHQLIGNLNGYVEFFSSFNHEDDSPWVGTVDMGLTYPVTPDIQFDGGVNIGVTRSADDFNPFMGCSIRY